jgi:hypothetical protein
MVDRAVIEKCQNGEKICFGFYSNIIKNKPLVTGTPFSAANAVTVTH